MNKIIGLLFISLALLTACKQDKKGEGITPSKAEIILENIHNRKSVRDYIPGKAVTDEELDKLLKAGMAAPSGQNKQPWEILVINEREILDKLAEGLPYGKMLTKAPMAIIVCGDTIKSNYWYLDCSLVSQNILLAAEAMGLGAVWTAAYPYEDRIAVIRSLIDIPAHVTPLNVIPVGHPKGEHQPKEKWDDTKIHRNKW
ncbi:nitroreductase [Parabacteroides sp. PF5-5]|uniref:nitroreductase family protein n=1 Tax=unclassified Parabacteroides TaxID=2649774 RepID=UPI002472F641|nr:MULTISPECIES: nitroreductase family protein [unclassified Parabacteroides]MDH6303671.1 nitroreductase [Parabacteroides sp. PH5-39]MDH6314288.1 nitroreductase [Parabacteroides sp. PF5-13]MDH6318648.1 nitroreductase [Parabacteroides sp. PH5-13]MDH6322060.1 nitroreductase [Parabacteroides sp. PH5-8]MDH6325861.1 nitroreductase [Parabacteroides sp. PH5-41]